MSKTSIFSWKRFLGVCKINLAEHRKGLIIALSIILGIHFIIYLTSAFTGPAEEIHSIFFINALFVAGLIATSLVFRDFYAKDRGYFSLLLPASSFEKYLSKFIITTAGYVVGGVVVYFVYSCVAMGVTFALFGGSYGIFNPFTGTLWKLIGGYLVAHSIFFFGAVFFRNAAYVKTLLSLIVLAIVFSIFASLVTALTAVTWVDDILPFAMNGFQKFKLPNTGSLFTFFEVMRVVTRIFFCFLMPPALWVIGFLRFKEIEVR
jgi:hypothetical protein